MMEDGADKARQVHVGGVKIRTSPTPQFSLLEVLVGGTVQEL